MSSDAWHYVRGSTSEGPVTTAEMEAMIAAGQITQGTLIWNETLPNWEPVEVHFEMGGSRAAPPVPGQPQTMQHRGAIGADGLYVGAPSRTFGEAIKVCWSKYATFRGRASRSEYWWFVLFNVLMGIATSTVDMAIVGLQSAFSPLNTVYSLAVILPSLAVSVRRLHDLDRTGWWLGIYYLFMIVFFVGMIGVTATYFETNVASDTALAGFGGVALIGGIIFLIYSIVLFVFFCSRGTPGENRYG